MQYPLHRGEHGLSSAVDTEGPRIPRSSRIGTRKEGASTLSRGNPKQTPKLRRVKALIEEMKTVERYARGEWVDTIRTSWAAPAPVKEPIDEG